jgi:DNA-binding CsgD family transcriptional regulator
VPFPARLCIHNFRTELLDRMLQSRHQGGILGAGPCRTSTCIKPFVSRYRTKPPKASPCSDRYELHSSGNRFPQRPLPDPSVTFLATHVRPSASVSLTSECPAAIPTSLRPSFGSTLPSGDRDLEIMRLLGDGQSLSGIASTLGVTYKTIANSFSQIKAKLGVARTADLVRLSVEKGLA